jgi:porin
MPVLWAGFMKRSVLFLAVVVLLGTTCGTQALAADAAPPAYSGYFLTRSTLTGDWGGFRDDLAERGVTFDMNLTQVEQGVVDGGKSDAWQYGGRANLIGNVDTQKLGLWPGGFFTLELEGNFGTGINLNTGAIDPVNTNQIFPVPGGHNFALPQLSFMQFVSPYFGAFAGKLDTLSFDMNEFAHGKGDTQFMNLAFNIDPVALTGAPYSPLGAGLIVLPTKDPNDAILNAAVIQSTGNASISGFGHLSADDLAFTGEGRVRTAFFGLTGHQLVGALYSNKQFTSIDQRLDIVIANRALAKKDGTWNVYYNFDQFVYETDKAADRGVGLFGRFGASDGNPNFLQYFFSAGVGGKGLMPSRPSDQFGLGYYYLSVANPTLQGPAQSVAFLRDEWGFEGYCNLAITPWLIFTPDIQVIAPTQKRQLVNGRIVERIGTATVLGVRLRIVF